MNDVLVLAVLIGVPLLAEALGLSLHRWAEIRRRNRQARLVRMDGRAQERTDAVEALSDLDPELRLLGELDHDADARHLRAVVRAETATVSTRVVALKRLALVCPIDEVLPWLDAAVSHWEPELQRAAIEEAGRLGHGAAAGRICELLAGSCPDVAAAAARALGQLGHAPGEPQLITALAHADVAVRCAAAEALGRIGTIAAVAPLRECARGLLEGTLRHAADAAVRSIQDRLVHAEPGQLAIADPSAGQGALSVAASALDVQELEVDSSGQARERAARDSGRA